MRDLTSDELDLISGGYDPGEDIVVTGSPYHPPYSPPGYYPAPGYYPPSYPPPPYGGGGGGTVSPPPAPTLDHATDQKVDALSVDLAAKIKAIPGSDHNEYGAWIYRDANGNIKESNILKGPDWGTSPFGKPAQDFGVPDGATLLGQIHNHPTYNPSEQLLTGRGSPDNFDLNAVAGAAGYAQPSHNIAVDTTNFRSYIMHDNVVDEYDRITHTATYDTSMGINEIHGISIDSTSTISTPATGGGNTGGGGSGGNGGGSRGGGHTQIP